MRRCFLDLDGCVVDFIGGVRSLFGMPAGWEPLTFECSAEMGITEDEFWAKIDASPRFWKDLEFTKDGKEILALVEAAFDHVAILTSPSRNPDSVADKVRWIYEHLPKYKRKFFVGAAKEFAGCAPGWLVDDNEKHCDKFMEWGGNAILLPRRWNRNRTIATLPFLRTMLPEKGFTR